MGSPAGNDAVSARCTPACPDPRAGGTNGQRPRIAVAVTHAAMRALIVDLLRRDYPVPIAVPDPTRLSALLAEAPVALVIVDGANFPACCRGQIRDFPLGRVIVIGAEPDAAYEAAALRHGAGAWIPRDDVGSKLGAALDDLLHRRVSRKGAKQ